MLPSDAENESWMMSEVSPDPAEASELAINQRPWRVLIVDDEEDIHSVTRLALREVMFKGRRLEMLSAYSGQQAFQILSDTPDIALALLDVVMESDDAGLVLVRRIREALGNQAVRLVLRTGQPGQAPEQHVIIEYDINDYKAKGELTTQKLFTTVIAALRSYDSLIMLERHSTGLSKILDGADDLYNAPSLREFASGVLDQIGAVIDIGADGILCVMQTGAASPTLVAATGAYLPLTSYQDLPIDHPLLPAFTKAFQDKCSHFNHPVNILFTRTKTGHELTIAITPPWPLAEVQRRLLTIFCQRIAAAFDNMYLYGQVYKSQQAAVIALSDLAEFRDKDTGNHICRVQTLSTEVALCMQMRGVADAELTPQLIEMIGMASTMHDVGKVSTPDHILLKPGRHTPEERVIMQSHAAIGRAILERAAGMVDGVSYLSYGAQIAGGHHEHFDGAGYPEGIKGHAIPLAARIVAAIDVFDALRHRRPYKEPWPLPDVISYLQERRGTQFDPDVVDALLQVIARPEYQGD